MEAKINTPLAKLREKITIKIINCEKQLQVIDPDEMPKVYFTTHAMLVAYTVARNEIESLLPEERDAFVDFAKGCQFDIHDNNFKTPEELFKTNFKQ